MSETSSEDLPARVAHLEEWVEVVMRTLARLGLESVLTELDDARAPNGQKSENMRRLTRMQR